MRLSRGWKTIAHRPHLAAACLPGAWPHLRVWEQTRALLQRQHWVITRETIWLFADLETKVNLGNCPSSEKVFKRETKHLIIRT